MYKSIKRYGHEVGLSCCFRQWRAASHCRLLHGYALSVKLEFEAQTLDDTNWVVDFGSLTNVKHWLQMQFDHSLIVAQDDPALETLVGLQNAGLARIVVLESCGCEKFAQHIHQYVKEWLRRNGHQHRVTLASVEVSEHGANSAVYLE